jgi:Flp pilus assembly protein TadD
MLFVAAAALVVVFVGGHAFATPAEAERLRARASKALERKDYKEAAELLEKAHKANPKNHTILKDLAVVYAGDGKIDEAAVKYREYLKAVQKGRPPPLRRLHLTERPFSDVESPG